LKFELVVILKITAGDLRCAKYYFDRGQEGARGEEERRHRGCMMRTGRRQNDGGA
jgi:hypothetical protein